MFETFVLSVVQSITEFLPVSSSGHLIAFRYLFGWQQSAALDIGMHLGTLLAVCLYFFKDLCQMFFSLFIAGNKKKLPLLLIVASIPIIFVCLCFSGFVHLFRQPVFVCLMLVVFGVILWLADKYAKDDKKISDMSFADAWCYFSLVFGIQTPDL